MWALGVVLYEMIARVHPFQGRTHFESAPVPSVWRSHLARCRLAVLPLNNLSGDADQEYFVEGTHEALITDLAGIGAPRVIARSSVMRYKGGGTPLSEIAEQLKVDVVLTGSVMRVGDRVRITAQLVDVSTEEHLWAGRYERGARINLPKAADGP